jgi:hypothetical protein
LAVCHYCEILYCEFDVSQNIISAALSWCSSCLRDGSRDSGCG